MDKKILFVSETVLFPMDRGNRKRNVNLIETLKKEGCTVDFLYLDTYPEEDTSETEKYIGEKHFFRIMNRKRSFPVFLKRKVRKALELLHCQFAFKFFSLDERTSPELENDMKAFFAEHDYAQVWVSCVYNSKVLLAVPDGTVKVLDTVNVSSVKRQEYEAVGYYNYEFALKPDTEREGLKRADAVIAIQNEEEKFFADLIGDGSRVFTIGENMPVHEPYVSDSKKVLFIGSTYVINVDGVMNFIKMVLPKLKEVCPEAEVLFGGSICKMIPDSDEYKKLGWVDSLDEVYKDARVVINPVRHGAGLNIKMVEALSFAKPVVSAVKGMRGLSWKEQVCIATDDPEEFACAVRDIIRDDELAMKLSQTAVSFMKEYEEKNTEALKELLSL